jgi:hypothetical protein
MSNNLEHLKHGDRIATRLDNSGHGRIPRVTYALATVQYLTATQLVCTGGVRVRRCDGKVVRGSHAYAIPADERIVAENAVQKARQKEFYQLVARVNRMTEALTRRSLEQEVLVALVDTFERFHPVEEAFGFNSVKQNVDYLEINT